MNSIVRAMAMGVAKSIAPITSVSAGTRSRTLGVATHRCYWQLSRGPSTGASTTCWCPPASMLPCCCSSHSVHTKGEKELVEFLSEEIVAERKAQKVKNIPTEFQGFKVQLDGAEVNLTKNNDGETINISFNVNHTVDSEPMEEDPQQGKEDFAEMKSKPQFEVDIVRGNSTLSFTCSFIPDAGSPQDEDYNDVFGIDEITMFQGEWNDKVYAVAGDVLDGYLYDLLMNLLEEKGISNEFAEKLSEFSTTYEHSAYIGLLEGLSKFTIGKQ